MSYKRLAEALLLGKPYFDSALRARQGVPERHQYFSCVVSSFPRHRPGLEILEIGSWAGASTVTWTLALRQAGRDGKVTCVDPWEAYFEVDKNTGEHYRQMNAAATDGLIGRLFEHNLRAAGVAEMVAVRRGTARNILPSFPQAHFDIIYIDGSHRFEDVTFDIREAKRLLKDGGVICGDDLEIEAGAVTEQELHEAIVDSSDYVFSEQAQCWYHPGVTGAVAKEFQAVDVWDGFWAVRRSGTQWASAALDLTDLQLPNHLQGTSGVCRLLESTANYNLVEAGGRYFAVAKALGSVDLFDEQLGDRALPPLLLEGESLEAVRREAELMSSSATTAPLLMDSYRGFNLVAYEGRHYALRQSLGHVDVSNGESILRQRFGPKDVLIAATPDLVKLQIDVTATSEDLDALRREIADMRSKAAERMPTQANSGAAIHPIEGRLDAPEAQFRTRGAVESDAISAQQSDQIRSTLHGLRSDLDAMSRQQQLIARQFSLLQDGPGDPQRPFVAGEHRGFSLIHYRGRVYGLRKGFEPTEAQLIELLGLDGSSDVIAAYSLDGARARIDVLEDARELYTEQGVLRQELVAAEFRLTEALRQVDATLQANARALERMGQTWPNRLLGRFLR